MLAQRVAVFQFCTRYVRCGLMRDTWYESRNVTLSTPYELALSSQPRTGLYRHAITIFAARDHIWHRLRCRIGLRPVARLACRTDALARTDVFEHPGPDLRVDRFRRPARLRQLPHERRPQSARGAEPHPRRGIRPDRQRR